MHAFSGDAKHVVFLDAFGLTRLSLPNRIKTDRHSTGRWLCSDEGRVLVRRERTNSGFLYDIASLKGTSVEVGGFESVALDGDGALGSDRNVLARTNLEYREERIICLDGARPIGALNLGERFRERAAVNAQDRGVWTGPGRTFAFRLSDQSALVGGVLPAEDSTAANYANNLWVADIGDPRGVLTVIPSPTGTFVSSFHPKTGTNHVVFVHPDGSTSTALIEAKGPVAWSGTHVVFEREREIVRMTLAGDQREVFALSETDGPGELMAQGSTLLRVSFDRETILDVVSGRTVNRKLPPDERDMRAHLLDYQRRFGTIACPADLTITLTDLRPPRFGGGYEARFWWDHGDRTPLAGIVTGNLVRDLRADSGARTVRCADGYSHPFGTWGLGTYSPLPVSWRGFGADQTVAMLTHCHKHRLSILHGFADCLDTWIALGVRTSTYKEASAESKAGMRAFLAAVLALAQEGDEADYVEAARHSPSRVRSARDVIEAIGPAFFDGERSEVMRPLSWFLVDLFGADAWSILADWLFERPNVDALARSASAPRGAAEQMMVMFPESRAPFEAAAATGR